MATYPPHLSSNWDAALKDYLDDAYPSRSSRSKHAPAFGLYFPEAEGAKFDGSDDHAAIQSAANAAAAGGLGSILLLPVNKSGYVASSVTIPAGITVRGFYGSSTLRTDQNVPIFTLGGDGITIEDLILQGSLPAGSAGDAAMASQAGILYSGTVATRLHGLDVRRCKFQNFQAIVVKIVHGDRIRVDRCDFDQYGECGVWLSSAFNSDVSRNTFNGTGQLWKTTDATYGATATVSIISGTLDDTVNPRSRNVRFADNIFTNQAWECLDTHLGDLITFQNNKIYNCPGSGIVAIANSNAPAFSPTNIVITGNTIVNTNLDGTAGAAINLNGSTDTTNPNRERATGTIVANNIYGHGLETGTSGAVIVYYTIGVSVSGNTLNACNKVAVKVMDSPGITVQGNTVVDVWSSSTNPIAFSFNRTADTYLVDLSSNTIARGTLSKPQVNTFAVGGSDDPLITVILAANEFGSAGMAANTQTRRFAAVPKRVSSAADQTVNNSTALVATTLKLPLEANAVYEVDAFVVYNSSTTADIGLAWAFPSGATMQWVTGGPAFSNTSSSASTLDQRPYTEASTAQVGGLAVNAVARPSGTVTTGATAGNLTLQFAQNTAEASDTIIRSGSRLKLTRIA